MSGLASHRIKFSNKAAMAGYAEGDPFKGTRSITNGYTVGRRRTHNFAVGQ